MIHYSCDRCQRPIHPAEELRYCVSIEIQVAIDSAVQSPQGEQEGINELNEIFEQLDEGERAEVYEKAYQLHQFDLCSDCHDDYISNPLPAEGKTTVSFSEN